MLAMARRERQSSSPWVHPLGRVLTEALGQRTKQWLADETGYEPATVSRILRGQQLPSLDQLQKLCGALGLKPRHVLARIGYLDDSEARYDALPGHVRRMIDAMADEFGEQLVLHRDDRPGTIRSDPQ